MDASTLIQKISARNLDVEKFSRLAISDAHARDEIIHQMTTHPHIMVYYNCYYVIDHASQERPELFYPYWNSLVPLLNHPNSYHRDIGMTILANLAAVDNENRFNAIFEEYFSHLNDARFMTAHCCVCNSRKIMRSKSGLRDQILTLLLSVDSLCSFPEKQRELMKADILEIIDEFYPEIKGRDRADEFIRKACVSISPKTKKIAKALASKYQLKE